MGWGGVGQGRFGVMVGGVGCIGVGGVSRVPPMGVQAGQGRGRAGQAVRGG